MQRQARTNAFKTCGPNYRHDMRASVEQCSQGYFLGTDVMSLRKRDKYAIPGNSAHLHAEWAMCQEHDALLLGKRHQAVSGTVAMQDAQFILHRGDLKMLLCLMKVGRRGIAQTEMFYLAFPLQIGQGCKRVIVEFTSTKLHKDQPANAQP